MEGLREQPALLLPWGVIQWVPRALLEGPETPLPPHVAHFWQWRCCFGSAAHVGSMIEAGIAVNILGKALYMERGGSGMAGLRQGWEGATVT